MNQQPTLLYLRGAPGTGKYTVAKILRDELGWPFFWYHQAGEGLVYVKGGHELGISMIYARPARLKESVSNVLALAPDHRHVVVMLAANYGTMVERVGKREKIHNRLSTEAQLAAYFSERPFDPWPGEHKVWADNCGPKTVAAKVRSLLA